jgi:hypothetical protein
MRLKTMRDLVMTRELSDRTAPRSRDQALTELARLEGEKARHERALEVWLSNQQKTERQLEQVKQRIALVQQSVGLADAAAPRPTPRSAASQPADDDAGWEPFVLKY